MKAIRKALIKVQLNNDVTYCDEATIKGNCIVMADIGEDGTKYFALWYFKPKKDKPVLSVYYLYEDGTQSSVRE